METKADIIDWAIIAAIAVVAITLLAVAILSVGQAFELLKNYHILYS